MSRRENVATLLEKANDYLRQYDPVLRRVIIDTLPYTVYRKRSHFESLVRIIIGQQLSTRAARTIFNRVKFTIGSRSFSTKVLSGVQDESLLNAGLSAAKLSTIRRLISSIESGRLDLRSMRWKEDKQVSKELTQIKGIGPWSAQMYLMFVLKRLDVFPEADTGILNAIRSLYNGNGAAINVKSISDNWRPFRTIACWYLWRYLDTIE